MLSNVYFMNMRATMKENLFKRLGKLLETVSVVQRRVNPRLTVGGVVMCMYESNTRLAGEVIDDVADFLDSQTDENTPWAGARIIAAWGWAGSSTCSRRSAIPRAVRPCSTRCWPHFAKPASRGRRPSP